MAPSSLFPSSRYLHTWIRFHWAFSSVGWRLTTLSLLVWQALQSLHPSGSSLARFYSTEFQGCDMTFCLVSSFQNPKLHHHMVTAAMADLWSQEINPSYEYQPQSCRMNCWLAVCIHSSSGYFPSPSVPYSLNYCLQSYTVMPDTFQVSPLTSLLHMWKSSRARNWTSCIGLPRASWIKANLPRWKVRLTNSVVCPLQQGFTQDCHLQFPGVTSQRKLSQHICFIVQSFFAIWTFRSF